MKAVDRWLQRVRINAAKPWIPSGASVLDVGTADGALFRHLGDRIGGGVGIDPDAPDATDGSVRLVRGSFPDDVAGDERFDVVTALAVFEHLDDHAQAAFAQACADRVKPGGRCVLTVPAPAVDRILDVLKAVRVIDGMHEGDHHGFDVRQTPAIFERAGFVLEQRRTFELGLNNLFVFTKPV